MAADETKSTPEGATPAAASSSASASATPTSASPAAPAATATSDAPSAAAATGKDPFTLDNQIIIMQPACDLIKRVSEVLAKDPTYAIHTAANETEALALAKKAQPCLMLLSGYSRDEIIRATMFYKGAQALVRKGDIKSVVVAKMSDNRIIENFQKLGCSEYVLDKLSDYSFSYKVNLHLKALRTKRQKDKKELELKSGKPAVDTSNKKGGSRITGEAKEVPFLDLGEDVWLIKGQKPKRLGRQFVMDMEGPDPATGEWVPLGKGKGDQEKWGWKSKLPPGNDPTKDGWEFTGQKPTFAENGQKWKFVGLEPDLSCKKDGKPVGSKVSVDEKGAFVIALDSPQAKANVEKSRAEAKEQLERKSKELRSKVKEDDGTDAEVVMKKSGDGKDNKKDELDEVAVTSKKKTGELEEEEDELLGGDSKDKKDGATKGDPKAEMAGKSRDGKTLAEMDEKDPSLKKESEDGDEDANGEITRKELKPGAAKASAEMKLREAAEEEDEDGPGMKKLGSKEKAAEKSAAKELAVKEKKEAAAKKTGELGEVDETDGEEDDIGPDGKVVAKREGAKAVGAEAAKARAKELEAKNEGDEKTREKKKSEIAAKGDKKKRTELEKEIDPKTGKPRKDTNSLGDEDDEGAKGNLELESMEGKKSDGFGFGETLDLGGESKKELEDKRRASKKKARGEALQAAKDDLEFQPIEKTFGEKKKSLGYKPKILDPLDPDDNPVKAVERKKKAEAKAKAAKVRELNEDDGDEARAAEAGGANGEGKKSLKDMMAAKKAEREAKIAERDAKRGKDGAGRTREAQSLGKRRGKDRDGKGKDRDAKAMELAEGEAGKGGKGASGKGEERGPSLLGFLLTLSDRLRDEREPSKVYAWALTELNRKLKSETLSILQPDGKGSLAAVVASTRKDVPVGKSVALPKGLSEDLEADESLTSIPCGAAKYLLLSEGRQRTGPMTTGDREFLRQVIEQIGRVLGAFAASNAVDATRKAA